MPPKKKKSGKKKKGKKSGGRKSAKAAPQQGEALSELSKEFYLVQIRDLENRVARYQKKCDELEVQSGEFREKYDRLTTDKKEIVTFLKGQLGQKTDEIIDLNDRLIGLQQAKDAEKEQYETQLNQLRTEFQETKDQLTSENMILGGKLASLEEFKVQKEDLMGKFAALEEELKKEQQKHELTIYELERKQVVDKDRLKKEMVTRVNQVAAEFRKVSNKQMAETTKRTIRENVSINAQLAKMSDKTMDMMKDSDELKDSEKTQRQQLEMLEKNEKELAKKNHSHLKIVRMLTDKCKGQEALIMDMEMKEEEYKEIDSANNILQQQVETTRDELFAIHKDNENLETELTDVKVTLRDEKKSRRKLEKIVSDCANSLETVLTKQTTEDVEDSVYEIAEKRDVMLENLLVLLNSAAAIGIGPAPGKLGNQGPRPEPPRSASQMPGSGKGIRRGELTASPLSSATTPHEGTLPHYQLGDLGLIPRPKQHIASNVEKMQELSATTRLGSLKKILTKSIGVQTVSAPKAMFYADQLMSKYPQTTQVLHDITSSQEKEKPVLGPLHVQGSRKITGKVF